MRSAMLILLSLFSLSALELGGLHFTIPDIWRALPSPSPSLHRWADASTSSSGEPITEQWLREQAAIPRLALAVLPAGQATSLDEAKAAITDLVHYRPEARISALSTSTLGSRMWSSFSHDWHFAGQHVFQQTWLTIHDGRCFSLSIAAGQTLDPSLIASTEEFLRTVK